jgi:NADPH-dependent curcumin reductase CurA
MSERTNTRITMASRPDGVPTRENFAVETAPAPTPGDGELLLKTLWLSLDPYMRGRMSDRKSYATPLQVGEVITAGVVAQVVESRHPDWSVGDLVTNMSGWQAYAVAEPGQYRLFPVDPENAPISTAVGVTGMPGQTAYFGLLRVGRPKAGETVVVSAASGAVGATVGQIAKIMGCRVVGVAGGAEKCAWCTDELGFDACVDYKADSFAQDLQLACPDGVDVYFENVGGAVLEAVAPLLNPGARVPVCGFISAYNTPSDQPIEPPSDWLQRTLPEPPETRFFVVTEWIDEFEQATAQLGEWVREGKLKYRETVVEGIENAPDAFLMLFRGENFGKLLVKVADPE